MNDKIWLFLLAVLALAACSEEDSGQRDDVLQESPLRLSGATRSEVLTDVHTAASEQELSPIQFFLTTGTRQAEGQFLYDAATGWSSTIGVKETDNFIYGFAPAAAASATLTTITSGAGDYSGGAQLSLSNLKLTGGDDICVIVGVEHGTSPVTNPDWSKRLGAFGFKKGANNYVSLLLDHLFARIDFKFKIGEKYSELRDVKIKRVELLSSVKVTGLTVTLHGQEDDEGSHPIRNNEDIRYTTETTADAIRGILYDYSTDTDHPEGIELNLTGKDIPGFFAPLASVAENLSLVCTYDVYNKIGTRVRENCTATNKLAAISGAERGKKWTLNLTVEPTYLYQLSDDEINNPSIRIDN